MTLPRHRTACPQCGAAVRADAGFCGQCYADFRPPPPPPSAPVVAPVSATYGAPAPDPLTAPLLDVLLPPVAAAAVPAQAAPTAVPPAVAAPARSAGWPCTQCETVNELTAMTCATCGSGFLQRVADESKVSLVLPVVGDLGRYSRGQRAGIAFGAVVVLLVPLALITLLLSGKPQSGPGGSTGTTVTTPGSTQPLPPTGQTSN